MDYGVCYDMCRFINEKWYGMAEITCHDNLLEESGIIGFGFDASGFIIDKSTSS